MDEWVYYRGGPKDGHVLLRKHQQDGYLLFDIPRAAAAYYRLTEEIVQTSSGPVPVALYVGAHPDKP